MTSLLTLARSVLLPAILCWPGSLLCAADWPQWMGAARDGVWEEAGIPEILPADGLVWSVEGGGGYAGPAVAEGRVYLLDRQEEAVTDTSGGVPGTERLRCLEAATGKRLWEQSWEAKYTFDYRSGPRATPTVHDGRVYVLGGEGHLACYTAADGREVWQHDLRALCRTTAPTWGFAGHPLVWQDLLICLAGGDGGTCIAFDRETGQERWRALSSSQAGYSPPAILTHEGREFVFLWHGEAINALDPASGRVLWTVPQETRYGVSMAGPVQSGDHVMVSAFWWGARMLHLQPGNAVPETVWQTEKESDRRTTHLNALMCTPLLDNGYVYGVCSYGQLRCLDFLTGERKWETWALTTDEETRWGTAFLTRLGRAGDRWLVFTEKGDLLSARLTPAGATELSRIHLLEPDNNDAGRPVVWSHPAYSGGCVFARNDSRLVCWRLAARP